jgi:peptide/nickel transport system substrate-binding protein
MHTRISARKRTPSAAGVPDVLKRSIPLAAAALSTVLVLSACAGEPTGSAATNADPVSGGTLTYATGDDEPPCLDSQNRGNVPQALLATQYLEQLFYQDDEGNIEPWLAKSWTIAPDGLSVDIVVADDVQFSDGTPLDAEAVKVNIERVINPETQSTTGRLALAKVTGVDVVDEATARVNLSAPDSALLESLSQSWIPIESPTALARPLAENCLSPVGTGPFVVESWVKQDSVTLIRNENYTTPAPGAAHEDVAYLDKIVWKFIPDASARFAALQSGQVDVVDTLQPENAVAAESDPSLAVQIASRPGAPVSFALNSSRPPFDDAKVREAFISAADIDSALESVYLGTVDRAQSVLSTATRYSVDNADYSYDPEKAADLLDEAGWDTLDDDGIRTKDGERLTVVIPTTATIPLSQAVYEQIQATAKDVGFDVQLQPKDTAAWWTQNNNWDYDAISIYYTKNSADVLRITFHSAANNAATVGAYHANNTHLEDPALDELLDEAVATSDDAERADLYEQAQQIIVDGYYSLPVYDQQTRVGLRSDVEGVRFLPSLTLPSFYDAWLDR